MRVSAFSAASLLALSVAALSCSSGAPKKVGPCALGELTACGSACSSSVPCSAGLYCVDSLCGAECTSATSERDCGRASACSADGRCLAGGSDAGSSADGGGTRADGGGGGGGDGGVCADIVLDTSQLTPNVVLIVDQSDSMSQPLGNTTRWEGLRQALLADDGILNEFQSQVRFGFAMYSARQMDPEPRMCPLVTEVDVAINNLDAIRSVYATARPIADTPTGDSIDAVLAHVEEAGLLEPDVKDPTIFILATDGEPDTCEQLNPQNGQAEAVASVERAFDLGVRTYVIAVSNETEISQGHLQDMANAGVGGTNAPSYRVNDNQGLRDTLRALINRELNCDVTLNGRVDTTMACSGTVSIGGNVLVCDGADGYTLSGTSQLTLRGAACDALKAGGTLKASFPCDSVLLQ